MKNPVSRDILPSDIWKWRHVERVLHLLAEEYNFKEIRTSIIQPRAMIESAFAFNSGSQPDTPATGAYYSLNDPSDSGLRIENTLAILHSPFLSEPQTKVRRLYYQGPMFPLSKRSESHCHHQFGFEILGSSSGISDIELMRISHRLCLRLGVPNPLIEFSSYGCPDCRPAYLDALRQHQEEHSSEYCRACRDSVLFRPLQLADCEQESCRQLQAGAPKITDYLCEPCRSELNYIDRVLTNLSTEHELNPYLHPNYGYYQRTVFRVTSRFHQQHCVIGSGGRYDPLAERICQHPLPSVGFAINLENLIDWLDTNHLLHEPVQPFRVFVCSSSPELDMVLLQITQELHDHSIHTVQESTNAPIEDIADLAVASRCSLIIWLSEDVIRDGKVWFFNLEKEYEELVELSDILDHVQRIRKSVQIGV